MDLKSFESSQSCCDAHEDMLARQNKSDFQILAHFAKRSAAGDAAHIGGRAAEFTSEGVSEVAVTGKPQFEGERGEIVCSIGESFERGTEAKPVK